MIEQRRQGRHWGWLTWALLGLGVGVAAGFWWGSYAGACRGGDQCSARWDAVGAVGTWVGGLGTIAAVLIAVQAFQVEERARRRAEAKANVDERKGLALERGEAKKVKLLFSVGSSTDDDVTELRFTLVNGSPTTPVNEVHLTVRDIDRTFKTLTVEPGKDHIFQHLMGGTTGVAPIASPKSERRDLLRRLSEGSTLSFDMNGRQWKRTAGQEVEFVP